MWGIMKEFNVLPTDERFRALTEEQINFIYYNKERDYKEAERASRGVSMESEFEDYNSDDWWEASHEDFQAIQEGHDEDDIAQQVENMTSIEDQKRLRDRFQSHEEYEEFIRNGGKDTRQEMIDEHINNKLKELFADAEELNKQGLSKWGEVSEMTTIQEAVADELEELTSDSVKEAISMFEDDEVQVIPGQDEDDYFEI
ncbi:tail protein [Listeria phage WIL-1]|uniref:tail protein n=1 Tax=Listeria phage WIL-1 TaxID=1541821 RepID=UPI00248C1732|nr:tail protein [Listeria phage WIL-1]